MLLGVHVPEALSLPKTCELMPDDSDGSNTFYCYLGAVAPGATRTVTLDFTAPTAFRCGETWPYLWVEPHTSNDVLKPDVVTGNNQGEGGHHGAVKDSR